MTELSLGSLGVEVGGGAVIGVITGYAAKKVAKLIAVLIGIQLAVFKFLESRGILTVDWNAISGGLVGVTDVAQSSTPPPWLHTIITTFSVSAGFVGGFLIGFKRG